MRRRVWQRVLAGVMGLWFASVTSGFAPVQFPDTGSPASLQAMGMAGMDQSMPSSHCAHMTDHHHVPSVPGNVPSPPGSRHCPGCPAACCATGVVTLVAGRLVALPVIPTAIVATVSRASTDAPKPVAVQVTLHPPLGPPSLSA